MPPRTIGVLTPFVEGSYHGSLLAGVQKVAQQHGVICLAIQTADREGDAYQAPGSLPVAWNMIDGWIGIVDGVPATYLTHIARTGKPIVSISAILPGVACPIVMPDNIGGMANAVRHLIEHGHRRIAFVGNLGQPDMQQRYEGYQAALQEHGIAFDPQLFFATRDHIEQGGYEAAEQLLASGVTCTAVVAATDRNAIGVMELLQSKGYRVPHDIALIGFDDVPLAQHTNPPLSSIRQRFDALGSKAAELLVQQLDGVEVAPGIVHVETNFVQRYSCGCTQIEPPSIELLDDAGQQTWQQTFARQLVALAYYPQTPPTGLQPADLWPHVNVIVEALEAALAGLPLPTSAQLREAWQDAIVLCQNNSLTLQSLLDCIDATGKQRLTSSSNTGDVLARLHVLLDRAKQDQAYASQSALVQWGVGLETRLQENFEINLALTDTMSRSVKQLGWLAHTQIEWACLGLWAEQQADAPPELEIVGTFGWNKEFLPPIGSRCRPEHFPMRQYFPASTQQGGHPILLLPLVTAAKAWGVLALVGSTETKFISGRGSMSQWTSLLGAAIERDHLIEVQEAQRESLRQSYERERMLADTVRDLGCPILPLRPGVLLVPLIGAIDVTRAQQLIDALLQGISAHQAETVLLDITGVPVVDTYVASAFIQAMQAATLLGARMVLVGVRPEIAHSLVALGVDLRHIATESSLGTALDAILRANTRTTGRR